MKDHAPLNRDVTKVLQTLLQDSDWEVRVTAMLAAGQLNAYAFRGLVDQLPIPSGSAEGLDEYDRHVLVAARQIVVAQLEGAFAPERFDDTMTRMPGLSESFLRTVLGTRAANDPVDRGTLLLIALTEPADTEFPIPEELPAGLVRNGDRVQLAETDIDLLWIAPVSHWLGDDKACIPTPNPIRRVTPKQGFFIAQRPLSDDSGYAVADLSEATKICERLSASSGAKVELPSVDQWEMAARGPDGRRYPSGNGFDDDMLRRGSPWGLFDAVGVVAQWTLSLDDLGEPLTCGKSRSLRCAARVPLGATQKAAIRIVVPYFG